MEKLNYSITGEDIGQRLDKLLVRLVPEKSRAYLQSMIEAGVVLVNEEISKSNYRLRDGDELEADWPDDAVLEVEAENIPLDILYEDKDIVVINKPKGMVVHPGAGNPKHTLVNALLYHVKDLSGINGVLRPGIVHRIDKDTSGCLVVAKHDKAHLALSRQLADHSMHRSYTALVQGVIQHQKGSIDAPIGRDANDRQKMAVTPIGSKTAKTHFQVLERYKDMTLVECQLETGRTHQIRVHFAYINHPLVGDPKYGPRHSIDGQGQMLHAHKIEFAHPISGEKMQFEAPLPEWFEEKLKELS